MVSLGLVEGYKNAGEVLAFWRLELVKDMCYWVVHGEDCASGSGASAMDQWVAGLSQWQVGSTDWCQESSGCSNHLCRAEWTEAQCS